MFLSPLEGNANTVKQTKLSNYFQFGAVHTHIRKTHQLMLKSFLVCDTLDWSLMMNSLVSSFASVQLTAGEEQTLLKKKTWT